MFTPKDESRKEISNETKSVGKGERKRKRKKNPLKKGIESPRKYFCDKFCYRNDFCRKILMKYIFVGNLVANFIIIFAINFYLL